MLYQIQLINEVDREMAKGDHICSLKGYNFAVLTEIKILISFMHMPNAYQNRVTSFKSLHQIL